MTYRATRASCLHEVRSENDGIPPALALITGDICLLVEAMAATTSTVLIGDAAAVRG